LPRAEVIGIANGAFQENCYILADADTRDAVLIDPGEEYELFLDRLTSARFALREIWLTHAHLDHVQGIAGVVRATGVPVSLHPLDHPLYENAVQQGRWFGIEVDPPTPIDRELADGDRLAVGGLEFEVRHVPGHSPGSVAFVGHGMAFVGDAVFAGSIGRVDLPGGDGQTLLASIRERLLTLPDETVLYSGHGPETSVGTERASNPFLTGAAKLV
jgi:hydroxyacylglutathione hydrolase